MSVCDLLSEFRENGSEQAFSEVVRRYTNLVYSAAKRRLSDDFLSQEATQIVFIRLAKAAPKLRTDAELVAWLHRTTLHVSIDLWRSESRRRVREEHAALMQTETHDTATWNELAPVLDEALNTLNDADRQTILLRFFQHQTMRDLGTTLGVSEDAAKMRVSRALERLRQQLSARGITAAATVLAGLLGERAVEAAPAQLAATLATVKFATHASVATQAGITQLSTKLIGAGVAAVVAITVLWLRSQNAEAQRLVRADGPVPKVAAVPANTVKDQEVVAEKTEPDPHKLLQTVAEARQRIRSGSLKFNIFHARMQRGHTETNHWRSTVVFDGVKRWFDSVGREYRYASMGDAAEGDEAKIREQGLDIKGAVRAGLLEPFEAHIVMMYDGSALFRYRETDGRSDGATIDVLEGTSDYFFDPRIFGLTPNHLYIETVNSCLSPSRSHSVQLLGQEVIDGTMAWHVRIESPSVGLQRDIWIDAVTPSRVVRTEVNGGTVSSTYYGTTADDPIPSEVITVSFFGAERERSETRFVRSNTEFNIDVDPAVWTLAGLQMQIGTSVADIRIQRRIGYWTGAGLSDDLPVKGAKPTPPPDRAELMALLETEPASEAALKAAMWILRNTPDGDDVDKASVVILQEHIRNPDLKKLAQELERLRHRSSTNLLVAMLEQNPNPEVQATACFSLATLFKAQWDNGANKTATAEAEKFFARVIAEFSSAGKTGAELARRAALELHELRNLAVGKPAPETGGEDMDGRNMNLSACRGNVVVLFFWSGSTTSDLVEHNKMAEQLAGKPVAFIGVNCDRDPSKAKAALEQHQISWPSFRDGRDGPIYTAWNIDGWPTIIILDRNGLIRYRGVRSWDVAKAVDALIQE